MNSTRWLAHFQQNRLNRPEPAWDAPPLPASSVTQTLASSLSHFQLGESGEGRFLLSEARHAFPDDPDYCEALSLFISEEQEHARLLERLVLRLGGKTISRHWSHFLFRLLRRALGVNFELHVLVIAELVGTGYYRLVRRYSRDPVVVQVCDLVLLDEAWHVAFHCERFAADQAAWLPLERTLWVTSFQVLFLAATAVAWVDHGAALRGIGSDRREFVKEVRDECIQFLAKLAPLTLRAEPADSLPA